MKTGKTIRTMCVLAGTAILATVANASFIDDAKISIDRALNSPTMTVRYSGASVAIVEFRLNGESIGTRSVSASKREGETNFNVSLTDLKDGDNDVEIRLYDRTGKLVGTERTNISTDQTQYGPVFLSTPKVGQSVMGSAEIKLGFGRELKNVYVSFIVDNNIKKMTNFPPYTFTWDTTGESNGWHEVEAWAIDESSNTFKTRKTRVFVNNPGGRTDRKGVLNDLKPSGTGTSVTVGGTEAGFRDLKVGGGAEAANGGASPTFSAPKGTGATVRGNRVKANVGGSMSDLKPVAYGSSLATGFKSMLPSTTAPKPLVAKTTAPKETIAKGTVAKTTAPTTTVVATVAKTAPTQGAVVRNIATVSGLIPITRGRRLPNLTTFAIAFDSSFVDFDVAPRVDEGVPMTPFRHLLEKAGGTVKWEGLSKTVRAKTDAKRIYLQIGDPNALVNDLSIRLETAPYLDRGRTIVPLSFFGEALDVKVEYDKETGHVLITSKKG